MKADEKRVLVERLVELTVRDVMSDSDMSTSIGKELKNRMRQKILQEQVELRLKHFELEQIEALLDFYSTDIGKSILKSQSNIDQELSARISIVSHDTHQEIVEDVQSGKLQIKPGRSRDDDT